MLVSGKAEVKTVDWSEDSQVFPAILFLEETCGCPFRRQDFYLRLCACLSPG